VISGEFAKSEYLFGSTKLAFPTCQVVRSPDEEAARARGKCFLRIEPMNKSNE
jgi:hypothetical protein